MKKRNTFLALGLIVAILVLGVGYAAISDIKLLISGTAGATVNDGNFYVHFKEIEDHDDVEETAGKVIDVTNSKYVVLDRTYENGKEPEVKIFNLDDLNEKISVTGLSFPGETVVIKIPIYNDSEDGINANLTKPVITNTGDNASYFDITAQYDSASGNVDSRILDSGTDTIMFVTVTLKKALIDRDVEQAFTIAFDAQATSSSN